DSAPIHQRPYHWCPITQETVQVEIDKLVAGILERSPSAWASPLVAVQKKDGPERTTVNYYRLNDCTLIPQLPLPVIDYIFQGPRGVHSFLDGRPDKRISPDCNRKEWGAPRSGTYSYGLVSMGPYANGYVG
ncbi:unnamed protein product, partial [Discosporangium mesarthrocarpum]